MEEAENQNYLAMTLGKDEGKMGEKCWFLWGKVQIFNSNNNVWIRYMGIKCVREEKPQSV